MIKVMLVDDEYWTRTSLRETIEWNKYGFEIAVEAEDANEGFEKYCEFLPDVVITDIRMGDTSGLDLVEKIHKYNSEAEFIVLSGYEQFDYAKSAYENGIQSYLLKPVDNDELLSKMLIIKEKIEKRRKESSEVSAVSEKLKHLKNNYVQALLSNQPWNLPDLIEKCELYGIKLPDTCYVVAAICIDNHTGIPEEEMSKISELLEDTIEYFIKTHGSNAFYGKQKPYLFNLVLPKKNSSDKDDEFEMKDVLYDLQSQLEFVTEHTVSIGFSAAHTDINELYSAYNEAQEALYCMAWLGKSSIVSFGDVPFNTDFSLAISNEDIEAVTEAIYNADSAAAKKVTDGFFMRAELISNVSIPQVQNVMSELLVIVVRSVLKNEQAVYTVFGKKFQPFVMIQQYIKIKDIKEWVDGVIDKLIKYCRSDEETRAHHPLVEQAISIIAAEYMNPLSIDSIAERLYLSRRYLMYLFKKETGQTIHAYLTDYRMDKAVELIKSGKYKIWEIGEMVGYQDSNYFGQVFKKVIGKTPQKYQESVKSDVV